MHVLFIHDAFPAQFGRLALELTERHGWRCSVLFQRLSHCPPPSPAMLATLDLHQYSPSSDEQPLAPWNRAYGLYLEQCEAVLDAVRARPELRPDLVVAHGSRGAPTPFLGDVLDCPIVNYCEYFFATSRSDLTYRIDLPPASPAPFFPRCINAPVLVGLLACDSGYAPTNCQRQSFPERFRPKIEVHFDGIDTVLYRPRERPRAIAGRSLQHGTRVVTYVARGLESMRGFDQFLRVAQRIARARPDVLFIVVGDEATYYGWDALQTGRPSFKEWVLARDDYDLSRFLFLGHIDPERLAEVLCVSDLHVNLTVPFVLSWSVFNALACGCTVLGSDVPPVRELIEPGRTGLVEPFFDVDRLTDTALRVLDDPNAFAPLGQAGRALVEEKYSLDVAVPALKEYFERVTSAGRGRG